jgi:lysophospholipase L1-like esterase
MCFSVKSKRRLSFPLFMVLSFLFPACSQSLPKLHKIEADHHLVRYIGRIDDRDPQKPRFSYPGTAIQFKFKGQVCQVLLRNESADRGMKNYYQVIVDGQAKQILAVGNGDAAQTLSMEADGLHVVTIFKRTESFVGTGIFEGIMLEEGAELLPLDKPLARKMEFIGNSITCGYGNEGSSPECKFSPDTENGYMSYAAITARNLHAEYWAVAYSGKGIVQNYDRSDPLTLPKFYDRIFPEVPERKWDFKRMTPDAVVINLGTNDFAYGVLDSAIFVNTYAQFVKTIRSHYPNAALFCIEGNMTNDQWPQGTKTLTVIKQYINAAVENQRRAGDGKIWSFYPSTMRLGEIGCDWHPNVKSHQRMADELTVFIKGKLGW